MTTIPFPPWEPDKAALNPSASANIQNVVPNADGYGPLPALTAFSNALTDVCRGLFLGHSSTGTYSIFAGTTAGLYKLSGLTWNDVSKAAGYALASGHTWSFAQFGDAVIAANIIDPVQAYTLGVSALFANLGGSPPRLRHVWVESGYLGGGQVTGSERTIYRSGLNDATYWTFGQRGSTYQPFPDGGIVQGAIGNETGAIVFQEHKIRQLVNRPGDDIGFSVNVVEEFKGSKAPKSIVSASQRIFYLDYDGFHMLGAPSTHIGLERIDRTFLADIDLTRMDEVQGVADEFRRMVWWRYSSNDNSGNADYTDKLIGYHWELDRWAYAEMNLEWIAPLSSQGFTLEELSSILGYTDLDAMTLSLDSTLFKGGAPAFCAMNSAHKLCLFTGDPLVAILDTADIPLGGEGRRHFVSGFRPVGDVSVAKGEVIAKSTFGDTNEDATDKLTMNATTGLIPCRVDARTSRFRLTIPTVSNNGAPWTHIQGLEIPAECARTTGRR